MSSWKLGKKIKDAIHKDHSDKHADKHADKHITDTRSPIGSRSTTPTPGSQQRGTVTPNQSYQSQGNALNPSGAGPAGAGIVGVRGDTTPPPAPPTIRSGMLKIRVTSAKGLSLPEGMTVPEPIQRAVQSHTHGYSHSLSGSGSFSSSMALSNAAGKRQNPSGGLGTSNRDSLQRKQQWWLPYVVLEFDKNEVLVDAVGGDLGNPVWMYSATFDVSRISDISIQAYLRNVSPGQKNVPTIQEDGSEPSNAEMGNSDLALGGVRFIPDLESIQLMDEWLPISGGTGSIHVQVAFKPNQNQHLTIDSFELLKVIGKGSFGKVMQVRKRDTLRIYALKTIRKAHIVSRNEVTHTLAERTVLAKVNNPFIVPLKFSFQSTDKLYLVLAFVNGGELFHHLQREGRFNEVRSRFYAAELLCALEHLHSFNVVYRDLKPENILLDYVGHIALCDFGLCKLNMSDSETTNTFCGTPEYLAPELLSGHGYTKCVDWWTLGVLLYEMLTGLPPFYDENTNEMYRKILQDPLRFPDDMGSEARSVLTLLLNRDPSRRLGVNGAQDIKNHPFFARHIDWKKLMAKKIQPPFKPAVASAIDTSNFDEEFTSEVPQDSVVADSHLSQTVQQQFEGFSWSQSPLGQSYQ
ncbi:Serine/threonine-protein kinase [Naganishia albida]|nr:Serine/threonine-protein kinase [Naganishia albida]